MTRLSTTADSSLSPSVDDCLQEAKAATHQRPKPPLDLSALPLTLIKFTKPNPRLESKQRTVEAQLQEAKADAARMQAIIEKLHSRLEAADGEKKKLLAEVARHVNLLV